LVAGACGFVWLKIFGAPVETDDDLESMDFEEDDED
jgi:hypothetical protein